jgi:hypothetical protein
MEITVFKGSSVLPFVTLVVVAIGSLQFCFGDWGGL